MKNPTKYDFVIPANSGIQENEAQAVLLCTFASPKGIS